MEQFWHYQNEGDGKRLGPVPYDDLKQLIADDRVTRSTLVWNPAMSEWAVASKTELLGLFGDQPPPLPASTIPGWPIWAMALLPLWAGLVVAFLCYNSAASYNLTPFQMYSSSWWIALYLGLYVAFAIADVVYLRRAGIDMRGAAVLVVIFIPAYIIVRGLRLNRIYSIGHMRAYGPLYLLVIASIASLFIAPVIFGTAGMGLENG